MDDRVSGAWCPRCARGLSFGVDLGGFGSCPEHGRVQAWYTEPTLVVDDAGELDRGARPVLGEYLRTEAAWVVYTDETREPHVREATGVSIVRWSDYEGEW